MTEPELLALQQQLHDALTPDQRQQLYEHLAAEGVDPDHVDWEHIIAAFEAENAKRRRQRLWLEAQPSNRLERLREALAEIVEGEELTEDDMEVLAEMPGYQHLRAQAAALRRQRAEQRAQHGPDWGQPLVPPAPSYTPRAPVQRRRLRTNGA